MPPNEHVTGYEGLRGTIHGPLPPSGQQVEVTLDDGARIQVPVASLTPDPEGGYFLPISRSDVQRAFAAQPSRQESHVIPVIQEEIQVGKRLIETGRVRVRKVITEHTETVDQPLMREEVTVERVPVNRYVDGPIAPRTEGDTLVVSVLEEVLVVQKRLVLREELRIKKAVVAREHEAPSVTLRREDVEIERIPTDPAPRR